MSFKSKVSVKVDLNIEFSHLLRKIKRKYFALIKYLNFSKKRFSCTEQNSSPRMLKYSEKFLWLKIFTAQKYQKGKRKRQQSYNQQTFFIPAENNSAHILSTVQLLENNFFDFFTVSYFFTALIFLHFGWYLAKHQNTWFNFSSLIFLLFFVCLYLSIFFRLLK